MEPAENFVLQNGTVDSRGKPADRRTTGGWKACYFILANEIIDRIAFFGILSNLITYMTTSLHQGIAPAAKDVSNWIGTIYMVTPLGGFVADAWLGQYTTVIISGAIYLLGLTLLTLSTAITSLRPLPCQAPSSSCPSPSGGQLGFFFVSLYLVALGSGCMKPCVSSFGANQFDDMNSNEYKSKASFFNWWFWGVHVGNILAVTVLVYIQDNVGWTWGFGIPTAFMAVSLVTFVAGTGYYRYQKPQGSVFTTITKVLASAIANWNIKLRTGAKSWNRATESKTVISRSPSGPAVAARPWSQCTAAQVQDTKLILNLLPIWLGTLLFSTVVAQNPTLFVKQGSTLDNRLGSVKVPPASMHLFTNLTVLCCIPLYDRFFVPAVRKFTGFPRGITMLQRMGTGMFITFFCMVVAGFVESKRFRMAHHQHQVHKPLPMSIFWLLPQYAILGLAEAFTYAAQLEFFYDQAPETMKSVGAALQLTNLGAGCFLSSILIVGINKVTIKHGRAWIPHSINNGRLHYFYWLLAALTGVNVLLFVVLAKRYKYKDSTDGTPDDCKF